MKTATTLKDFCEEVDAYVFSSDMLFDDEQREMLKQYINRWLKEINEHERWAEKQAT